MRDCERSTCVQSFVCANCLISFEVISVKIYNGKIEKYSHKRGMNNLFLAVRGTQAKS